VEKGQGVWAKQPSSSSLPHDTERKRQNGRPVEGVRAPATQAMGAAGKWGKMKRRSRATHSAPHLGRGRTVEGDRRRRAVFNPERYRRRWWWRWRARGGGGIGRGGAGRGGEPVRPFYRRGKAVRVKIFELRELQWPSMVVGENIMALTSGWRVPVRRGTVGSDSSCRPPLWPRRGKQRRRVVVEVTGRSNGDLRLSGKKGGVAA
jgi:hypothetical protein